MVPPPPITCEIRGKQRTNASAKDSKWVADRKAIEAARAPGVEELILQDTSGRLVEGSQTNFFAVIEGVVYTAEEGILSGTVRDVVLQVSL